LRVPG